MRINRFRRRRVTNLPGGWNAGFTVPFTHTLTVWGEGGAAGFFEDIHVLIVVVLGMSILLGSLAAAYATHESAREAAALREETSRILRAVLTSDALVHRGERALIDVAALDRLNATGLALVAGTHRPLQLVIAERSGETPRVFFVQTSPVGPERTSAATAISVWHSDLDIRPARITITLGG